MRARGQFVRCEIVDVEKMRYLGFVIAQNGRFRLVQNAQVQGLGDLSRQLERSDKPRLDAVHSNAFLQGFSHG